MYKQRTNSLQYTCTPYVHMHLFIRDYIGQTQRTLRSILSGINSNVFFIIPANTGNKISSLPPDIGKLVLLQDLCLTKNALTALPAEMGEVRNWFPTCISIVN